MWEEELNVKKKTADREKALEEKKDGSQSQEGERPLERGRDAQFSDTTRASAPESRGLT